MEIWGRANSVNVQKVLWACEELGLDYSRIEAGGAFGVVDTPQYRAMNPNGRVPTLVDGDFVLWESNSILRYLAQRDGVTALYPTAIRERVSIDRWLDWVLSTLQPAERPLFWGMVRTKPQDRDQAAIDAAVVASGQCWSLIDARLQERDFVEGDGFSLADIVLGSYVHRWFAIEGIERPAFAALEAWYGRLRERPAYLRVVAVPLT